MGPRSTEWWLKASEQLANERTKKMVETNREKGTYDKPHGSWKSAWRTIGGKNKFFRSRWEANYARYLEHLKCEGKIKDWLHEPQTFWFDKIKRGCRSYLPDFKVIRNDDTYYWVEVKGWMDDRSKTKLKRFTKYFPDQEIILIQAPWFKENESIYRYLEDWE